MKFKRKSPSQLQAKLENMNQRKSFDDATEWKLATDKMGNGGAVIRFLPAKGDDDLPFVKIFTHGFKENGQWYIENCPSTIEQPCPCCKANGELWNTIPEAEQKDRNSQHPTKKLVQKRKRGLSYWANIVVIKDEANPDNEGKVFKYRFGSKILDKITAAAQSDKDLGIEGTDVTCVFEGANFALKVKRVSGFPNYDDSKFGNSAELFGGDEGQLERVWNEMHDLNAIVSPDNFKEESALQQRFLQVTGGAGSTGGNTGGGTQRSAADDLAAQASKPATTASSTPSKDEDLDLDDTSASTGGGKSDSVDDELDDLLAELELDD
ncbi:single strand DNA binding protein [Vibrio phage D479]